MAGFVKRKTSGYECDFAGREKIRQIPDVRAGEGECAGRVRREVSRSTGRDVSDRVAFESPIGATLNPPTQHAN